MDEVQVHEMATLEFYPSDSYRSINEFLQLAVPTPEARDAVASALFYKLSQNRVKVTVTLPSSAQVQLWREQSYREGYAQLILDILLHYEHGGPMVGGLVLTYNRGEGGSWGDVRVSFHT